MQTESELRAQWQINSNTGGMTMEIPDNVLAAMVSAIVGGVFAYLTMSVKIKKDLVAKYDLDLRNQRIHVYRELWKCFQPLAKYSRSDTFTKESASTLSGKMRAWYYDVGGIFLSERTRDAFFDVQDLLEEVEKSKNVSDAGTEIPNFESLRTSGSTLRTAMARDVGTRRKGSFRYE